MSRSHTISNTYILPVGNTPYRKRHNTRTICITPLQSILEESLHSRQSFLVKLTDQFNAFFNPKTPQRRTLKINNKCSKQILTIAVSRNSCPVAPVTMFYPTLTSCGYCCYLCVPCQLGSPPGFRVTHMPEGRTLYYYV